MVITEQYSSISGTATDAYDLSNAMDVFLVNTLGWGRQHTLVSGASNIDRVYTNNGGESGNPYDTIYYRVEAISGTIFNHAYTYYAVGGGSSSNHMEAGLYTSNPGTVSGTTDYHLIGNKNLLWLLTENMFGESGSRYASSVGYCDSYYTSTVDNYPVCLVGQAEKSYGFSSNRVVMYGADTTQQFFFAEDYSGLVKYGSNQLRDGSVFGMSIALMITDYAQKEMRGELRGIKQIYGIDFISGDTITASGTSVSGTFYVVKHDDENENTFAFGPYEEV